MEPKIAESGVVRPGVAACVYGLDFLPLLATFLESWSRWSDGLTVFYSDVPPASVNALAAAYPQAELVEWPVSLDRSKNVRISQKMLLWKAVAARLALEDQRARHVIFADIDTIALKDPAPMCVGDIVVSHRSEGSSILLNSGVVALSENALRSPFMEQWFAKTEAVLRSETLMMEAVDPRGPYGGGDQMALMNLLGISRQSRWPTHWGELALGHVACGEFNACENHVDLAAARILHLKASIQSFLLRRHPFTGSRTPQDTAASVEAARRMSSSALQRLDVAGVDTSVFEFKLPYGVREDCSVPWWLLGWTRIKDGSRSRASKIVRRARRR